MSGTSTLPAREQKASIPFALAFGVALSVSTAACVPAPAYAWTSTTPTNTEHTQQRYVTSSGGNVRGGVSIAPRTPADGINELRSVSGLTVDQISRLFGVSRRSVHNWITGNPMAASHHERMSYLLTLVRSMNGSTPDLRRAELLDSSGGVSLFHQLLAQRPELARVLYSPTSPSDRLG